MTIRTICGPPGAGKTTYVAAHAKPEDLVVDLDEIRTRYSDRETAASVRSLMERTARDYQRGDVWIIRTLADPAARHEHAQRVGADEVIVLATPPEAAARRAQERDGTTDLMEPITRWWETYSPHDGDITISPDRGDDTPDKEHTVGQQNSQNQQGKGATPPASDAQQAQQGGQQEPDRGFPADTPLEQMTVEQREAYWRHHSRKHERTANSRADYDDVLAERDRLRAQLGQQPEPQRQQQEQTPNLDEVRSQARAAALAEVAEERVRDAFANRAFGVEQEDLDAFLEHLNLSTFITDGRVDTDAVNRSLAMIDRAPAAPARRNHLGRRTSEGASSVSAGRERYKAQHQR
jgi:predicted kinase